MAENHASASTPTAYQHHSHCRRLEGHHAWTKEIAYKNESEIHASWEEYAQMGVLD
jgi:hypothetical protein